MSDLTIPVGDTNITAVVDSTGSATQVQSIGIQGPSSADVPLSSNMEVDITTNGKVDGSVLVYKSTTSKWTATKTLDAQNMEGGFY
jgi:hypothetical protein